MLLVWLLPLVGCALAAESWHNLQPTHEGQMISVEGIGFSGAERCSINLMPDKFSILKTTEIYYHFRWSYKDNQYTMSTKTDSNWAKDKKAIFHKGVTIERGGKFKVSMRLDGGDSTQWVRTWAGSVNLGAYGKRESPLPLDRKNVKYVLVEGDCELTTVTQEGKNYPKSVHGEPFPEGALYFGYFIYLTAEVVESEMYFLMYNKYDERIFSLWIDTVNNKVFYNQDNKETLMSTNLKKGDLVNLRIDYFRDHFTMELNGQHASFGKSDEQKEDGIYTSWKLSGSNFNSLKVVPILKK